MAVGAFVVIAVTELAPFVGSAIAGLLAMLPIIGTILAVFAQRSGGPSDGVSVQRGILSGLFGTAAFLAVVAWAIAPWGIVPAFLGAIATVVVVQVIALRVFTSDEGAGVNVPSRCLAFGLTRASWHTRGRDRLLPCRWRQADPPGATWRLVRNFAHRANPSGRTASAARPTECVVELAPEIDRGSDTTGRRSSTRARAELRRRLETPEVAVAGRQRARLLTRLEQLKKQHAWGRLGLPGRTGRGAGRPRASCLTETGSCAFDAYRARVLALPDAIAVASGARGEELRRIVVERVVVRDRHLDTIDWTRRSHDPSNDGGSTPKGPWGPTRSLSTRAWRRRWTGEAPPESAYRSGTSPGYRRNTRSSSSTDSPRPTSRRDCSSTPGMKAARRGGRLDLANAALDRGRMSIALGHVVARPRAAIQAGWVLWARPPSGAIDLMSVGECARSTGSGNNGPPDCATREQVRPRAAIQAGWVLWARPPRARSTSCRWENVPARLGPGTVGRQMARLREQVRFDQHGRFCVTRSPAG